MLCKAILKIYYEMVEKYGRWSVKELKTELKERNAKCVGKKEALIER